MRISTSLKLGLLLVLFINGRTPYTENSDFTNCDRLEVTYSVNFVSSDLIEISIAAAGGVEPYHYLYFDKKNSPLNWEFSKNTIRVKKGQIPQKVNIIDAEGCIKTIQFNESEFK